MKNEQNTHEKKEDNKPILDVTQIAKNVNTVSQNFAHPGNIIRRDSSPNTVEHVCDSMMRESDNMETQYKLGLPETTETHETHDDTRGNKLTLDSKQESESSEHQETIKILNKEIHDMIETTCLDSKKLKRHQSNRGL